MPQCKHYAICRQDVGEDNFPKDLCILHSTNPHKDIDAFAKALVKYRKGKRHNFSQFTFPNTADFSDELFEEGADFSGVTFWGGARFSRATFSGAVDFSGAAIWEGADFDGARFSDEAAFSRAAFNGGTSFNSATFSASAHFDGATFTTEVSFHEATFTKKADFNSATFSASAHFDGATFSGETNFSGATFRDAAYFAVATFSTAADFSVAKFSGVAFFFGATFSGAANFFGARFSGGTSFNTATFSTAADFSATAFSGRALFAGRQGGTEVNYIFSGTVVNFTKAVIDSPDVVTFLKADLMKCRFLDTDLRKVELVDVKWPQKGQRVVVYDEIVSTQSADRSARPWSQIERHYRELKQNYEDRRDYERAGDFHYGEKEMRRKNPNTARGLRLFLTLYWLFSGYGERYLRPLLWAGLLFVGSTIGYLWWGLRPKDGGPSLTWINGWDWLRGAYYSFRVMTFLKPEDWVPLRYAQVINTVQTLLAPIFLGLFALALRQRLKR
jgi:uncharacterized protein YjbI with pentapeptide repeats